MYGIYANIWGILMVNVTVYSIHGSYGKEMCFSPGQSMKPNKKRGAWSKLLPSVLFSAWLMAACEVLETQEPGWKTTKRPSSDFFSQVQRCSAMSKGRKSLRWCWWFTEASEMLHFTKNWMFEVLKVSVATWIVSIGSHGHPRADVQGLGNGPK